MKIVSWNIRAGGGRRAERIAARIEAWCPDMVALSEFRGTAPSRSIAKALNAAGLEFQRSTADAHHPTVNALLVASRWPLRVVRLSSAPEDPHRWLHVNVAAPRPLALIAMHAPNRVTGRKLPFLEAVTTVLQRWRGPAGVLVGDTNSGRMGIDEESSAFDRREHGWLDGLDRLGWRDAFRVLHPRRREFTWYSPNGGNGFRLDQAFVHHGLLPRLRVVRHDWGGRRGELSDHAALLADFEPV